MMLHIAGGEPSVRQGSGFAGRRPAAGFWKPLPWPRMLKAWLSAGHTPLSTQQRSASHRSMCTTRVCP